MYLAIGVEPTNDTAWIPGWPRMASTDSLSPCSTFSTPSGSPASWKSSAMRNEAEGTFSEGDRHREHPQRHHHREIERRDAGTHADGLPHGMRVHLRAGVLGVLALQEMRDSAGELDHFDPALHGADRVGKGLAVLFGND